MKKRMSRIIAIMLVLLMVVCNQSYSSMASDTDNSISEEAKTLSGENEAGYTEVATDSDAGIEVNNAVIAEEDKNTDTEEDTEANDNSDEEINSDMKDIADESEVSEEGEDENTYPSFVRSCSVDGIRVTVTASEGAFPEGATLSVSKVTDREEEQINQAVEAVRDESVLVAQTYTYDIKVLDENGTEIQPANGQTVNVSFAMNEVSNQNLSTDIYHIPEENGNLVAEELSTSESGNTVTAVSDGFSYYTVEFTYNEKQYVMEGDSTVALTDVLSYVGITKADGAAATDGDITAVSVSDESLFSASNESGEWKVTAHQAFHTDEWMKVTVNGVEYLVEVTDAITQNWVDDGYVLPSEITSTSGSLVKNKLNLLYYLNGSYVGITQLAVSSTSNGENSYTYDSIINQVEQTNWVKDDGCTYSINYYFNVENDFPYAKKEYTNRISAYPYVVTFTAYSNVNSGYESYRGYFYNNSQYNVMTINLSAPRYTVTYNTNSGTDSVSGLSNTSQTIQQGSAITLPSITRAGYTFNGWYTAASDGSKAGDGGASYTPTANVTLYAQWTAEPATEPTISSVTDTYLIYGYAADSGSISVTASAVDGHTLSYQWYDSGTTNSNTGGSIISGATNATYSIPTGKDSGTYYYYCVVTATRTDNGQTAAQTSGVATVNIDKAAGSISYESNTVDKHYADAAFTNTLAIVGDGTVSYSSDNTNVATVDSASGAVTIHSVGTAHITATVEDGSNYTYATEIASYTLNVGRANLSPSVTMSGWTYGETASTPEVDGNTENGAVSYKYKLKDADDTTYTDTIPNNAGNYTVKATIAQTDNYNSSEVTADFAIAPKPITVTAENKSKIFGEADPQLTYSVSENGLVGSDTLSNINLSRTDGENVGTYAINVNQSDGSNQNYNITFVPGTFTIGTKSITPEVALSQDTFTYNRGQQKPTVYVRYNGTDMSTSDYEVLYSTDGNNFTTTIDSKDKGTYYIKVEAKDSGNYTFDSITKTYTINPKPIDASMVTLTDERYVYDGNEKQPVVTVKDGSIPLTDSEYEIDTSSIASATNYGTYHIVVNGKGNYTGSYTAVWSITKKAIEGVTINGVETTYDGEPHKLDVTIPDNATITYGVAPGEYILPGNPGIKDAGVYTIYYKVEIDDNYETIEGSKNIVINPKAVTLTTTDKTMTYGEDDPTFGYTVEGMVGDDTLEGITFSREAGEDVGEYLISATNDTSKNANYDITIVNTGKLTIQPKELTISDIVIDDQTYTGKELEPTVIIKDGDRIIPSTEYTVEYSDNIEPGKAKVTIKDVDGGNYIIKTIETTFNIIDPGIVEVIEPETPNANEADFAETPSEVISKIELTDDDKEAKKNGKNIFVFLEVEDISETVPSADKKLVEDVISTSLEKLGIVKDNSDNKSQSANAELKIGMYLDISLFKQVEGESKVKISETSGTIKIAFEIPEALRKDGRSYYIVKVHDGVASLITPSQSGNTLTFETDQFSTYALVYMDKVEAINTPDTKVDTPKAATTPSNNAKSPSTGDNTNVGLIIILMVASAMATLYLTFRRKKIK